MKAYLLPVTLAVSLGVNATLLSGGVQEVNAVPLTHSVVVCADLDTEETATVESFLGGHLCDPIKEAFGIDACPADAIRQRGVSIKWDEDTSNVKLCTHPTRSGNWVDGE